MTLLPRCTWCAMTKVEKVGIFRENTCELMRVHVCLYWGQGVMLRWQENSPVDSEGRVWGRGFRTEGGAWAEPWSSEHRPAWGLEVAGLAGAGCHLRAPRYRQKNMTPAQAFVEQVSDQKCFKIITLVTKVAQKRQRVEWGRTIISRGLLCFDERSLSEKGAITTRRVWITVIMTRHWGPVFLEESDGGQMALAKAQVKTWVAKGAYFCFPVSRVKTV